MMARWLWGGLLLQGIALGCAGSDDGDSPSIPSTTTSTGGGGGGGGNAGGSGASGGTGGGACTNDCSTVVDAPCFVGVCDEETGRCAVAPEEDGVPCDDGQFCTVDDQCVAGACVGASNDCGMPPNACQQSVCDEVGRSCILIERSDGTSCETDNRCLLNPTCTDGVCGGDEVDCFFFPVDDCSIGQCNPDSGRCEAVPANQGMDCVEDLCVDSGTCDNGACIGQPKDCSGLMDACNDVDCDPGSGACFKIPKPTGTSCPGGTCDIFGLCQP